MFNTIKEITRNLPLSVGEKVLYENAIWQVEDITPTHYYFVARDNSHREQRMALERAAFGYRVFEILAMAQHVSEEGVTTTHIEGMEAKQ